MLQTGLTPLHLAAQEDRVNAAEVLAKHDANLDQQTKVQTHTNVYTNTLKGVRTQKLVANQGISWMWVETPFETRNFSRTSWNYTNWLIKVNPPGVLCSLFCMYSLQAVLFTSCLLNVKTLPTSKSQKVTHAYKFSISATCWLLGSMATPTSFRGLCICDTLLLYTASSQTSTTNQANLEITVFLSVSSPHPLYTSARIYPSDSGLPLWKCQDGELPVTAGCKRQRQNQGRIQMSNLKCRSSDQFKLQEQAQDITQLGLF